LIQTGQARAIRLTADIEGLKTRVSGSTWENGDAIRRLYEKSGRIVELSRPGE